MIVRILRGRVSAAHLAAFRAQARQAMDDARRHDGFVDASVGRQMPGDGSEEVVLVTVWRDLESLYRWVGGTDLLETPVLNRGPQSVFDSYEVQHYEGWDDVDPVEAPSSWSPALGSAASP